MAPLTAPIVLVVDADSDAQDHIAEVLSEEECILFGAASPSRALWLARRRPPSVVIISADSVSNPAELVLQLQEIAPHLRALITTRAGAAGGAASLAAVGAILQKPFDGESLRSAVHNFLKLAVMTADTIAAGDDAAAAHAMWHRIATTRRRG